MPRYHGRGRGNRGAGGGQKRQREGRQDEGRGAWSRDQGDRRGRNEETKRRRLEKDGTLPVYATEFSKEEIEAEERKPKKKVAVMIGYSGSGFKGLQLSHNERTIEGELFKAFVKAGAISKANADDPKKNSLVRCARTDKGVHAVGNVLSLKLIIEDEDIVQKINDNLDPQIRVWGYERTNGSFSAYHLCDSRIYEYLIPTHCFLPPHPKSYLGRKLVELAEEAGDLEGYTERQAEVASFWSEAEEKHIKPVLDDMDPELREEALRVVFEGGSQQMKAEAAKRKQEYKILAGDMLEFKDDEAVIDSSDQVTKGDIKEDVAETKELATEEAKPEKPAMEETVDENASSAGVSELKVSREFTPLEIAVRNLKAAYANAKRAYRLHPKRLERIRSSLSRYVGTHNYHNYTINRLHRDPSSQRVMNSFVAADKPTIIKDTEWLSLKVHGQSIMTHQIRKMVSMCALVVRCGTPEARIQESFGRDNFNIPKAPGLGLLLERPIFDSYNKNIRNRDNIDREKIEFTKYEKVMEEFKQREIYERIFKEEEEGNFFHAFLTSLDFLHASYLLFLSSKGHEATKRVSAKGDKEEPVEEGMALEGLDGDEDEEQASS